MIKNYAFQKALARGCSDPAQNGFDTQRSRVCDYCELCALSSITAHSFASGTDMAYSQCMHSSLQSRNKSGGGHGVVEAVNKMTIATKSAKCFTVSSRNFKHVAAVKYLQWQKKKKKSMKNPTSRKDKKLWHIFHKREQRFIWQFVKWRTAFNSFHHLPIKRKDEWRKLFGLTVTSEAARRIKAATEAVWQPADNHANKLDISKWVPLPYNPFPVLKNLFKPASSSPKDSAN